MTRCLPGISTDCGTRYLAGGHTEASPGQGKQHIASGWSHVWAARAAAQGEELNKGSRKSAVSPFSQSVPVFSKKVNGSPSRLTTFGPSGDGNAYFDLNLAGYTRPRRDFLRRPRVDDGSGGQDQAPPDCGGVLPGRVQRPVLAAPVFHGKEDPLVDPT